eukprot:5785043-Pleurochrysis_carterae.AAC.2
MALRTHIRTMRAHSTRGADWHKAAAPCAGEDARAKRERAHERASARGVRAVRRCHQATAALAYGSQSGSMKLTASAAFQPCEKPAW